MYVVLFFLLCLTATTIGAITGIGGGMLIRPVLDAFTNFSVPTVNFLSSTTVLFMTIVTLLRSKGSGIKLEKRISTLLAVGAIGGGTIGNFLLNHLVNLWYEYMVGAAQAITFIIISSGVVVYLSYKERLTSKNVESNIACVCIGLVSGTLAAFLGIGGGILNVLALSYLFSMQSKTATLNSVYIMLFAQGTNFISAVGTGNVPEFSWIVLAFMVAGGISGGFLGNFISRRISNKQTDRVLQGILCFNACISAWNLYNFLR